MASQGGTLKSTSINGVKMYSVTGQNRSTATWLNPKKQRALRKDKDYMQRVELVQDLRFETATTRIKATPDGEYIIASGIYPPQIKVFELRELALKFERHLVSEIVDFEVLSDDYSKMAFLCADRSVCIHAKYGSHYSLRIPRMGRDMAYDDWSCDLLCAASSPDLYRINLEQGRFLAPLNTQSPSLNVVSRSKSHGLVACGGEDGFIECFDMRANSSVARLDAVAPDGDVDQEITAIEFDGDGGYLMGVGSSAGKVLIYDLRSSVPIKVKDHMYGSPILNIKWHKTLNSEGTKLVTTDKHVVRIWDPVTGEGMTSIEPTAGRINDICVFNGSGLILLALDSSQIPSYFIPALGPAPKWCSYLENMTEELEESAEPSIYDDYKFLTKEDLVKLNLTNLIGTNLLRAYMHGFFIDYKLYKKAQAHADPFAYEKYLELRKQEKLEKARETRITVRTKLPKVNKALASQILDTEAAEKEKLEAEAADKDKLENEAADTKKTSKKKKGLTSDIMNDERFSAMFQNPEFEIDQYSQDYRALHPMSKKPDLIEEHFEPIPEEDDDMNDASTASHSSDDEQANGKARVPKLYEVKDERHAEAFGNNRSLTKEDSLSLAERAAAARRNAQPNKRNYNDVKFGKGGSREITFMRKSSARYKEDNEDMETPDHKRRGIQSLKLKQDGPSFRGRGRGRGGFRGGGGGGGGSRGSRGRGRGRR